jgi:hypothetical protein
MSIHNLPWLREREMNNPLELRKLAVWYREFAERAGNPVIWEARLKTAEALERAASQWEGRLSPPASSQTKLSADP